VINKIYIGICGYTGGFVVQYKGGMGIIIFSLEEEMKIVNWEQNFL